MADTAPDVPKPETDTPRSSKARRVAVAVAGSSLVLVGIVFVPMPVVPGWIFVIAGLTVLSWEFYWARRILDRARSRFARRKKPG